MSQKLTDSTGWPASFAESNQGRALKDAIKALPGSDALWPEAIERHARILFDMAEAGEIEALPRFRDASRKASEKQLIEVAKLAERLANALDAMKAPAADALARHGFEAVPMADRKRALQQASEDALIDLEAPESATGRPRDIEAEAVAEAAAGLFESVTGRKPSFYVFEAGEISGDWPDFLGSVYAALDISASVESQVRNLAKASRGEK